MRMASSHVSSLFLKKQEASSVADSNYHLDVREEFSHFLKANFSQL